jgi:hypothetical protein
MGRDHASPVRNSLAQFLSSATCAPFFAEKNTIKADEIAARQAWLLSQHLGPRAKQLPLTDAKEMFAHTRDQVS